ncbi:MAG TPA: serine/threonine-protein kinase [Kineobactrum sp.]
MNNDVDQATEISDECQAEPLADIADLALGRILNRRFVIEAVLGRGGMGVVYRALDLRKQESGDCEPYVALKVLSGRFRHDPRMAAALQREARKAQSLAHPNVTTVYDFDRDGDLVYITMEEMSGQPLDELIAAHPQGLARKQAAEIILGASRGLAYAHSRGVVHADFKPSNIFFTEGGDTRILDFGIARAAPVAVWNNDKSITHEPSEATQFVTGELSALTPAYAAMEMFSGLQAHPADDVYALAIVSYKLLTGRHPYNGLHAPEAHLRNIIPRRPRGLQRHQWLTLRSGLAFERERRPADATEFLRRWRGRGRVFWLATSTALVSMLALGYIGWEIMDARLRHAPDIPFDNLPREARYVIEELLDDAVIARRAGEQMQALALYEQAYRLHPRNRWVVDELERLLKTLVDAHLSDPAATTADRAALLGRLQAVLDTDDWLGGRGALLDLKQRLAQQ